MARHEIHVSDIRAFKQCRRRWNWSSPLRRNLEPAVPYAPFFTGRAIHHCLEQYYRSRTPFASALDEWQKAEAAAMTQLGALWPAEAEKLQEQLDLIAGMLDHYKIWVDKDVTKFCDDNLEFITLETEFNVPLYNPSGHKSTKIHLAGRFDGVVRSKVDGSLWVWENKTTRSIQELTRSLANDEQCGVYLYAAEYLLGEQVVGVLYNIMRKKVPAHPQVLQNGTLSKNKSIDTSAEMYLADIRALFPEITKEQILAEFGDILNVLLAKDDKFFQRVPVYRTPAEIATLITDVWTVGLEMTRDSTPIYPAPNWLNCNFCSFRAPCLALNSGADTEFLLSQEYQVRQGYQSLQVTTEESNG